MDPQDLQILLREELTRRLRLNPRYSLRAFARHLGVSPSYVSLVMNGKRRPANGALKKLALKLGVQPNAEFNALTKPNYTVIADWYHYAILELITLPKFTPSFAHIATALGITQIQAKMALERLLELQLLKKSKGDRYELTHRNNSNINNELALVARKNMQRQLLELALRALDEVPLTERDHSSMTMAIDSRRLTEARERIKKFRRELCDFLQASPNKDSVYTLSVALYPHFLQKKEKQT